MVSSNHKRPLKISLALVIIIILIGSGSLIAYLIRYSATSERVCQQCHPEIITLWKNSNGHPSDQTKCYECHSQTHKAIPKDLNFFKHARDILAPPEYLADDPLTSQRCLDCHEDILNPGYKLKKQIIKMNHRFHHEEGLTCTDCHRSAGHEYATGGTNRPSVEDCLNCHLKEFEGPPKNQKCLNCHDVMLAPGKTW